MLTSQFPLLSSQYSTDGIPLLRCLAWELRLEGEENHSENSRTSPTYARGRTLAQASVNSPVSASRRRLSSQDTRAQPTRGTRGRSHSARRRRRTMSSPSTASHFRKRASGGRLPRRDDGRRRSAATTATLFRRRTRYVLKVRISPSSAHWCGFIGQ